PATPEIGECWIGPRPSLAQVAGDLGLVTRGLADLDHVLDSTDGNTLVVRDADRDLTDRVDAVRAGSPDGDAELSRNLSELRLVKDAYEINEMRRAVDATKQGFDD